MNTKFKYFTLLELLIVIAVIGILLTLLLPSLNRAKERGYDAVCRSNISQWGVMLTQLITTQDTNTGQFPAHKRIRNKCLNAAGYTGTKAYHKELKVKYSCPSLKNTIKQAKILKGGLSGYHPNGYITGKRPFLSQIDNPSELIFWGEGLIEGDNYNIEIGTGGDLKATDDGRHMGRSSNVWIVDGHVESGTYVKFANIEHPPLFEFYLP